MGQIGPKRMPEPESGSGEVCAADQRLHPHSNTSDKTNTSITKNICVTNERGIIPLKKIFSPHNIFLKIDYTYTILLLS